MNKEFWNDRYAAEASAYGTTPNVFFKKQINQLDPGKMLLPCEGEGRNAVYAASLGWKIDAFDISNEGKAKAEESAAERGVSINYDVCNLQEIDYPENHYDAVAMIFTHFPSEVKNAYHQKLADLVKPGGFMILEGFSKDHLAYRDKNPKAGGPPNKDMLYSIEEIKNFFANFKTILLEQKEVTLEEGLYHQGLSSVVRFVGKKN